MIRRFQIAALLLPFAFAAPSATWALGSATELFLPAVAHARGDCPGGVCSEWRSDVWIRNGTTASVDVTIAFLARNQPNPVPTTKKVTVPPSGVTELVDVVLSQFGLDSASGALRFTATKPIEVAGRIYDANVQTNVGTGTAGQFFVGMPTTAALEAGSSADLVGLAQDAGGTWRTNFGVVETAGFAGGFLAELFDEAGALLAAKIWPLGPRQASQFSLADLGAPAGTNRRLRITATGYSGARVLAYASRIDNRTGDPSTVTMSTATPGLLVPSHRLVLPSVAHGPGVCPGGVCAAWRSDVWVSNPWPGVSATVTVSFLARDADNTNPVRKGLTVGPGETKELVDVVSSLFGLEVGSGALTFDSDLPVVVTGRVYDANVQTNRGTGTAGQYFAASSPEASVGAGESTELFGLAREEAGAWRSNFGLVETTGTATTVDVDQLDAAGAVVASKSYSLRPREAKQTSVESLGGPAGPALRLRVRPGSGGARVVAFGSRIDNRTGDPFTIEMTTPTALAPSLLAPGSGVVIEQWDLRGAPNSRWGRMSVDLDAVRAASHARSGYLNGKTTQGWVIQNVPVFGSCPVGSVSASFLLSNTDGDDVTSLGLRLQLDSTIRVSAPPGATASWPVGSIEQAVGGRLTPASPGIDLEAAAVVEPLAFNPDEYTFGTWQAGHVNIDAATSQCGPAAAANSLAWLHKTDCIDSRYHEGPGLGHDPAYPTLVGELDVAMGRSFTSRTNGSGVQDSGFVKGKLKFLSAAGLGGRIAQSHQSVGGTYSNQDGLDASESGLTSKGKGTPKIDWILGEISRGEDVELGFHYPAGGGHWVDATGGGSVGGVPFVTYVSDALQTDLDPTDTKGTSAVDFTYLTTAGGRIQMPNEPGQPILDIAVSESPVRAAPVAWKGAADGSLTAGIEITMTAVETDCPTGGNRGPGLATEASGASIVGYLFTSSDLPGTTVSYSKSGNVLTANGGLFLDLRPLPATRRASILRATAEVLCSAPGCVQLTGVSPRGSAFAASAGSGRQSFLLGPPVGQEAYYTAVQLTGQFRLDLSELTLGDGNP